MMVHVTARHIARGKPQYLCGCPVALALNAAFPGKQHGVTRCGIFRGPRGDGVELTTIGRTPRKVRAFVERFDDGQKVRPFSFRMPRPC